MRLVYLSPVPWRSFSQRPHELARYFHARTGGEVLWIDPYPTRLPGLSDLIRRRPDTSRTQSETPPWLRLLSPKALPIEPLPFSSALNSVFWREVLSEVGKFADTSTVVGLGKPSALGLGVLSSRRFVSSFYDAMDDFPAFYRGWSQYAMEKRERKVLALVNTVLVSSTSLYNRIGPLTRDVRLVLNACASGRLPVPRFDRAPRSASAPVVGYVGTIAQWFDWPLINALADANPSCQFRIIGPVYGQVPSHLRENIRLLPPVPHAKALQAMAEFDVGLIPFRKTPLTRSVDPIKYYEYRAMGVPVLSTDFGQMAQRGEGDGVFLLQAGADFAQVLPSALRMRPTVEDVEKFRAHNSWEARFDAAAIFPVQ